MQCCNCSYSCFYRMNIPEFNLSMWIEKNKQHSSKTTDIIRLNGMIIILLKCGMDSMNDKRYFEISYWHNLLSNKYSGSKQPNRRNVFLLNSSNRNYFSFLASELYFFFSPFPYIIIIQCICILFVHLDYVCFSVLPYACDLTCGLSTRYKT